MKKMFRPEKPTFKGKDSLRKCLGKTIADIEIEQVNGWLKYKAILKIVFTDGTQAELIFKKGNW